MPFTEIRLQILLRYRFAVVKLDTAYFPAEVASENEVVSGSMTLSFGKPLFKVRLSSSRPATLSLRSA